MKKKALATAQKLKPILWPLAHVGRHVDWTLDSMFHYVQAGSKIFIREEPDSRLVTIPRARRQAEETTLAPDNGSTDTEAPVTEAPAPVGPDGEDGETLTVSWPRSLTDTSSSN